MTLGVSVPIAVSPATQWGLRRGAHGANPLVKRTEYKHFYCCQKKVAAEALDASERPRAPSGPSGLPRATGAETPPRAKRYVYCGLRAHDPRSAIKHKKCLSFLKVAKKTP